MNEDNGFDSNINDVNEPEVNEDSQVAESVTENSINEEVVNNIAEDSANNQVVEEPSYEIPAEAPVNNQVEVKPENNISQGESTDDYGFTGEYGKSIPGQRYYSYDGNSIPHPREYINPNDEKVENNQNNSANFGGNGASNNGYNNASNNGYNNAPNNGMPNNGFNSQNNGYNQNNGYYQNNGYNNYQNNNQNNNSKKSSDGSGITGKKLGATVILAIVFGIVAGLIFTCVHMFSSMITNKKNETNIVSQKDDSDGGMINNADKSSDIVVSGSAVGENDISSLVEMTMPSMVIIACTSEGQDYFDIFGQFYKGKETASAGSGFIIGKNDDELLIATNNHVVEGTKEISTKFIDDEVYEATIKGTDAASDLAVIAVKLSDLKSSTQKKIAISNLGDSNSSKVGEKVIAIGNSLGYGQSVTVGYLSAKDREVSESSGQGGAATKIKVLQTDAAINPGNSGGPLLNMKGEVIGINSAKIASSTVEGVGYAIPISDATPIINELMDEKTIPKGEEGYLGVTMINVSDLTQSLDLPEGVYVQEVAEDGAADEAGIVKGDIITAVDSKTVIDKTVLKDEITSHKAGEKIKITYQRLIDGEYKESTVDVTLKGEDSMKSLEDDEESKEENEDNENGGNDFFGGYGGIW